MRASELHLLTAGLIALSCSLCSAGPVADARLLSVGESEFDFVMLTREWPFSFCSVNTKCQNKQLLQSQFNIHGLWAELDDSPSKPPMFCHTTFDPSQLTPIQDDLKKYWMNLLNPGGNPLKFWQEEFKKHGSCVATDARFNSTYLYFKAALSLSQRYDLLEMLRKGGVIPGSAPIDASKIRKAVSQSFGFRPMIRCAKSNDKVYLYELRLCFNKDLEPRDCASESPRRSQGSLQRILFELNRQRWSCQPAVPCSSVGTYECQDGEMTLLPGSMAL